MKTTEYTIRFASLRLKCLRFELGIDPATLELKKKSKNTEKMAAVHFPSNALRPKIVKKANGCFFQR